MAPVRIDIKLSREIKAKRCFFSFKKRNKLTENKYDISIQLASGNVNSNIVWDGTDKSKVADFLQLYRRPPLSADFDTGIATAFRKFLFSNLGDIHIDEFNRYLDEEIIIAAEGNNARMLTNFPWELCFLPVKQGGPAISGDGLFLECLSRTPVYRMINGSVPVRPQQQHALNFLYSISDPNYNDERTRLPAHDFDKQINQVLKKRRTLLDFFGTTSNNVTGDKYKPSFQQLITQIDVQRPNVLILVSHGQTINGVPQLYFEEGWKNVDDLANHLKSTNSVYIVYLIACDLAFYDDGATSASGAKVLLDAGIPAVVAMQSSILAKAGVKFIESLVDHMLTSSVNQVDFSLARAVKFARHTVYRDVVTNPKRDLDWTFPALFMGEGAQIHMKELSQLVNGYIESLKFMLKKNFPVQHDYYPRLKEEESIQKIFHTAGIHFIKGKNISGKTTVVRQAGEQYLQNAIDNKNTDIRPLLYIDLSSYRDNPLENVISLINIINEKIKQLQFPGTSFSLIKTISASDIMTSESSVKDILVSFLENTRLILILDNITTVHLQNIGGIIAGLQTELRDSVVIVLTDDPVADYGLVHPVLVIDDLTQEETGEFVAAKGGDQTKDYFRLSGGNIFALKQLLKGTVMQEDDISRENYAIGVLASIQKQFGDSFADSVLALSVLPLGLNPELAEFFPFDWEEIEQLKDEDFIWIEETDDDDIFYFVPAFIAQPWQYLFNDNINNHTQAFIDQFAGIIADDPEKKLPAILNKAGGFEFIRAIILMIVKKDINDQDNLLVVQFVCMNLHTELYKRSEWFKSYEIWSLYLNDKNLAIESTESIHWLRFGKTALLLGFMNQAQLCIEKARTRPRSALDIIELNDLEAGYFKAAGLVDKKTEIEELYQKNARLIEVEMKANDADLSHLKVKKALNFYNWAIFQKWWNHDIAGARGMLAQARKLYQEAGEELMMYVLEKEEADMLIDDIVTNPEFQDEILDKLHRSRKYFEGTMNRTELNEIYYRLGRFYKKLYGIKKEIDYLNKSISYYGWCEESARESNYFRMEQFAYGYKVVLSASNNNTTQKKIATEEINKIAKRLMTYSKDVWSVRVVRNFKWWQALFLKEIGSNEEYLEALLDNFKYATTLPLHPHGTEDLGKAAMILQEIIRYYETNNLPAELIGFYYEYKEQLKNWFNDPDPVEFTSGQFKEYLNSITIKPNYYG
ncbi:MAG: CHAT domain-containing protein [Chitinophagaceae bacterium]|nr:CHAT domain-containing protein [Chitinophagaceae bacterium]